MVINRLIPVVRFIPHLSWTHFLDHTNNVCSKLPFKFEYIHEIRNYFYLNKIVITHENFEILFKMCDYLSIENLLILVVNWIFDFYLMYDNLNTSTLGTAIENANKLKPKSFNMNGRKFVRNLLCTN